MKSKTSKNVHGSYVELSSATVGMEARLLITHSQYGECVTLSFQMARELVAMLNELFPERRIGEAERRKRS